MHVHTDNGNHARILKVARDFFNTRGYRSVTIQEIAEQLGMSKKTIYQYYSGKEEIAEAVVMESMSRLDEASKRFDHVDKNDSLRVIKEVLIEVREESMRFGPLFLKDMEKYLPDLASRYKTFRMERREKGVRLLQKLQDDGVIDDNVSVPLLAEILSTCMHALATRDAASELRYSRMQVLDTYMDIFCKGIAAGGIEEEAAAE
ncbi:TetR/AcrR family transcriptional regulator [Paenibacillus sp. J5C_2022]|uniref:TetR/AcrR family transcriptional regulator n=1 Tax=Paenibacillus sp. J5C2022 TaxID=2977129 RepID=UPI0021D35D07|nr:TetR/AcrR family transcriptional regulator [Paenibacillus sp. J5C2022]MCU6709106.1 TetR/AcrR family transcriptional regulator [Paenibacillus sp. J5C2022]